MLLVQNQATSWGMGLYSLSRGRGWAQLMMPKAVLWICTRPQRVIPHPSARAP